MAKSLDGVGFLTYCRRLKLSKETQAQLRNIRESPPSRTLGTCRGNMPVWYPSKKCNASLRPKATRLNSLFCCNLSMMMTCWRSGINPRPLNLNIKIGVVAAFDHVIPLITFSFDTRKPGGSSVSRLRNSFAKPGLVRTATSLMNKGNGAALLGRRMPQSTVCSTKFTLPIKSTGQYKTTSSF